jgi:hypothetical protein
MNSKGAFRRRILLLDGAGDVGRMIRSDVLAAALAANPGARIEPDSSAVAPAASASAVEPAARPVPGEGTRTKPAGAPARLPSARPSAANGTPPR